MAPIVDGTEDRFGDQIAVRRVNAISGDGPAIMQAYRLQGHPTVLIFDAQGREVRRLIGPQSQEVLDEVLLTVLVDD